MKTLSLLILLFFELLQAQIVNIPDTVFKNRLLQASYKITIAYDAYGNRIPVDTNGDGEIQYLEALTIYRLILSPVDDICQLTGIDGFTNLVNLNFTANKVENVDLSTLVNLKHLHCNWNELVAVDVSNNILLEELRCDNNEITYLDLSTNPHISILSIGNESSFSPNPIIDFFQIKSDTKINSDEIYDQTGRIINTGIAYWLETKQNVSAIPSGTYFVKIITDKGTVGKKLIKK